MIRGYRFTHEALAVTRKVSARLAAVLPLFGPMVLSAQADTVRADSAGQRLKAVTISAARAVSTVSGAAWSR
jgi:hypothetical protein